MEKDKKQPLLFKSLDRTLHKKVTAAFDGGEVSSDTGLLLLKQTEQQTEIIKFVTQSINDDRRQNSVEHKVDEIISQRVYQIAAGYEDANDADILRTDPILKMTADRLPLSGKSLASQPTISRFENRIRKRDLLAVAYAIADNFISSYSSEPELIVLDFDDTEDKTHGLQQGSLFNGYHNSHCYMPLHVYEGISGKLIATVLRSGKRPKGEETVSILRRIVKRIRSSWPNTTIIFRGDAHYCAPCILRWCDEHHLLYCIGLAGNSVVRTMAEPLLKQAMSVFKTAGTDQTKLYDSIVYQAKSWDKPQRVIVKAEVNSIGTSTRFVVTNIDTANDAAIYKDIYCARGQMENYIKEHKLSLKSGRTSCTDFYANQFRLFLHSIAYVLMHSLRENILKSTSFAKARFDTIRLALFKIGARVRELKTSIKIHLPSSCPYKSILIKACSIFNTLPKPDLEGT